MNHHAAIFLHSASHQARTQVRTLSLLPARKREWPLKIFRPQPAVFDWGKHDLNIDERIANAFYLKCYRRPIILNSPSPRPDAHVVLQSKDLIEQVLGIHTHNGAQPQKNRFSYLLGPVGNGKSAYLNYVLTRFGLQLFEEAKIWFLRVDLEKTYNLPEDKRGGFNPISRGTLLVKVVSKLIELFGRFHGLHEERPVLEQQVANLRKTWNEAVAAYMDHLVKSQMCAEDGNSDSQSLAESAWYSAPLEAAFADFVRTYREATGRRLWLILDNADVVIHSDDREVFTSDGRRALARNIEGIVTFLQQFAFGHGPLDLLSASITCVMREDTFQILNYPTGVSFQRLPEAELDNVYSFKPVEWDDVFESRMDLADKIVSEDIPVGTRSELMKFIERMKLQFLGGSEEHQKEQREIIEILKDISSFGNRGLVQYFSHYAELHPQYAGIGTNRLELAARYRTTALISFFLRNNQWFSQEQAQFPNIYLVNVPEGPFRNHRPSYWLKRLVLEMIRHCQDSRITPEDILYAFAGDGSGSFYDRSLVEVALGSMADVQRSNLISVSWGRRPGDRGVYPTGVQLRKRALRCMQEIFDSFAYLQVVVDDELLYFPMSTVHSFCWRAGDPTYGYFAAEDKHTFSEGARAMIRHKGRKVMLFLIILEEALQIERQIYHGAFGRLEQRGIMLPNVGKIRKSVARHLARLHRYFGLGTLKEVVSSVEPHRERVRREIMSAYAN